MKYAFCVIKLENKGIGRPATFAADLLERGYHRSTWLCAHGEKTSCTAPLGLQITDFLCGVFSFIDYDFTRNMEESLDEIATGKAAYKDVLSAAHTRKSILHK